MSVKTRIIGVGNPLCGDDGVGVALVERLRAADLPHGVELLDGGLGGLSLIDYFADVEQVILVDAVDFGAAAGEIAHLDFTELSLDDSTSLQQLHAGLAPLMLLACELHPSVRVDLVAVQPAAMQPG
ncbi:MAG: hypothetical protein C0624_05115, partial [Desulfuromonas sp.]